MLHVLKLGLIDEQLGLGDYLFVSLSNSLLCLFGSRLRLGEDSYFGEIFGESVAWYRNRHGEKYLLDVEEDRDLPAHSLLVMYLLTYIH